LKVIQTENKSIGHITPCENKSIGDISLSENKSIGYITPSETEGSTTEVVLFGHVMRENGMERDMMLAYGDRRRRKRQSDEEVDGGYAQDVRDESGGAEGCG